MTEQSQHREQGLYRPAKEQARYDADCNNCQGEGCPACNCDCPECKR